MKRTMFKPLLVVLAALFLSAALAGCGTTPEEAAEAELDAIKNLSSSDIEQFETFSDLTAQEDSAFYQMYKNMMDDIGDTEPLSDAYRQAFLALFDHFDYEITGSDVVGRTATVHVAITNYDMEALSKEMMIYSASYFLQSGEDFESMSTLEQLNLSCELLLEVLDQGSVELTETRTSLTFNKNKSRWELQMDDYALDALYSNFISISNDPFLLSADEYVEIIFSMISDMDVDTFVEFSEMGAQTSEDNGFSSEFIAELCRNALEMFSYEIVDHQVDGNTATVTVNISCFDFGDLVNTMNGKIEGLSQDTSILSMTQDQIIERITELYLEAVKTEAKSKEDTIMLQLYNNGESWEFQDETVINECFFGTSGA